MFRLFMILAAIVLMLHGLIHLMGTAVYMKLSPVDALPYKTVLLDGRWEIGESGMRIYGALWALAAVGFVGAAVAFVRGWDMWQTTLTATTILSLVITALDWRAAYMGVVVNLIILLLLSALPWLRSGAPACRSR